MKFLIAISLGNATMKSGQDIRAKLAELSADHSGPLAFAEPGDRGMIRDDDGNTVGYWKVTKR